MKKKLMNDLFIFAVLNLGRNTQLVLETVPELEELLETGLDNFQLSELDDDETMTDPTAQAVLEEAVELLGLPLELLEQPEFDFTNRVHADVIDSRMVRMVSHQSNLIKK